MVVDDSKLMRMVFCTHIEESGHEAIEAEPTSIFDVLTVLYHYRPHLLVTDYEMPNCNGETLIRTVREDPTFRTMPIIVVSAHGEPELIQRLEEWGKLQFRCKPLKPEALFARIQDMLGLA